MRGPLPQLPQLFQLLLQLLLLSRLTSSKLPEVCRQNHHVRLLDPPGDEYDPSSPPPLQQLHAFAGGGNDTSSADSNVIRVFLENYVTDVTAVNDKDRTASLQIFSFKVWNDPRVKVKGGSLVFVSEDFFRRCLWSPTFIYVNLHATEGFDMIKRPHSFMVDPASNVIFISYSKVTVGCVMDFSMYPFDKQVCDLLEMSMETDTSWLLIEGNTVHNGGHQRELQYSVRVDDSPVRLQGFGKFNFSSYGTRLVLERRLNVHIMETYLPTSLFVVASWISFLIPPEVVPGRMGLLVTLLLVQINISLRVSDEAPQTPEVTGLSLWCILCIVQTMAVVLQYGFLLHMSRLGLTSVMKGGRKPHLYPQDADPKLTAHLSQVRVRQQRIDKLSFLAFPLVWIAVSAAYWSFYLCRSTTQDAAVEE